MNPEQSPTLKLELRLLGAPEVRQNGVVSAGLTSAKAQALLYYLAMTRRVHRRAALASLLWSEHGEEEARGNLRKAIQQLREQLDAYLAIDRDTIQLRSDQVYWVDAVEFATQLSTVPPADPAQLQRALALYRGDFLEGLYIRNAPEFEAWMLAERARLREIMLQGLVTLAERYASGGDLTQAITTGRRLLELEPWREEVHCQLMEWLAQNGQRSAALAQYEICCRVLAEELAVEPSQATRETYERLLRRDGSAQTTPTPHLQAIEYALVGRRQEWQTLRSIWHKVRQGGTHCVSIAGEAGIGKTRLAEELLVYVQRQGYTTARARTYALEGRLAYGPVADWLRTETLHPQLSKLNQVWLSEVARLLPELLVEHPDLPPPPLLSEPWQRKRLFDALVQAVTLTQRPLLLLLDDLQWCDTDTLEWVQYLLGAASQAKLLVVGTVRSEEVDDTHPLHKLWQHLLNEGKLTTIGLEPLTAEETAALGAQVAQQALDAETAGWLYRETTGNPLFVVESVLAHKEQAEVHPDGSTFAIGSGVGDHAYADKRLPPKVYGVIQARLTQLSAEAHTLAHLAAAVGRAFTVELLMHANQQDEERVVRGMDELWRRRLVQEQAIGSYDFSHDRIREVAYTELSPVQRRLLHRRIAQSLEHVYTAVLDTVSGQIAAQYELAGLPEQALPYYQQAAEAARRICANFEAAHHLQKGLALLRNLPGSSAHTQQELEMQVELASVLMDIEGWAAPAAEQAYLRAFELCQQAEKTTQLFPTLWGLHEVYLFQAKYAQARTLAEQCLALARRTEDPDLLLQAHHALWATLFHLGANELTLALTHAEQGITLYNPQRHHTQVFHYGGHDPGLCCRQIAAKARWLLGYPQQGCHIMQEALALGHQLAHPYSLVASLKNSSIFYVLCREPTRVAKLAAAAIALASEHEFPQQIAEAKVLQGWALAMQGDVEQGIAQIGQGIGEWRALGIVLQRSYHLGLLAEAYTKAGQVEAGLTAVDEALAAADASGERYWEPEIHRLRGELSLQAGGTADEAEIAFQQAIQVARQQKARSLELRAAVSLSRLWQKQGRVAEAQQLLAEIYNWFTEGFDTVDLLEAKALLDELQAAAIARRGICHHSSTSRGAGGPMMG